MLAFALAAAQLHAGGDLGIRLGRLRRQALGLDRRDLVAVQIGDHRRGPDRWGRSG